MSIIPSDGLNELKAALRKRAVAIEHKSESVEKERENPPPPPPPPSDSKDKEEVFVESKFHRKGSKVYKNHGWKYSRSDSCASSSSSRNSVIIKEDVSENNEMEIDQEEEEKEEPIKVLTADEREEFVNQKYQEIIDLFNFVGIEVKQI